MNEYDARHSGAIAIDNDIYQRVNDLVQTLSHESQAIAALPEQMDALERLITPLTAPATIGTETAMLARNLRVRINQIIATLHQFQSEPEVGYQDEVKEMLERAEQISQNITDLQPQVDEADSASKQIQNIEQALPAQKRDVLSSSGLLTQVNSLLTQAQQLQSALPGNDFIPPEGVQDIRDEMPHHPTKEWPTRPLAQIKKVIVHHTVTSPQTDPIALANAIIERRDLPGLMYHFLVQGNGFSFWTESLTSVVLQTFKSAINAEGVAVALAGNFTNTPPPDAQLDAAAAIIAELVKTFGLDVEKDILGRNEIETVGSPGKQWLQGAQYKFILLEKVRKRLTSE